VTLSPPERMQPSAGLFSLTRVTIRPTATRVTSPPHPQEETRLPSISLPIILHCKKPFIQYLCCQRKPEQISAGATAALRDGMRERRRREWCDREGRSSVFQRKMRPRSGMPTSQQYCDAVEASPPLPDPRFAGPLGLRSGALLRQEPDKADCPQSLVPFGLR